MLLLIMASASQQVINRLPAISQLTMAGVVTMLSLLGFVSSANAQLLTDRIIVKYNDSFDRQAPVARLISQSNVLFHSSQRSGVAMTPLRALSNGAQLVQVDNSAAVPLAIQQLQADPAVEYAEPDVRIVAKQIPSDPRYPEQWYLYEMPGGINAPNAWQYATGVDVVVAVLDTGYRPHADLVANLLPGYDFITDAGIANDGDGRDGNPLDTGDAAKAKECDGAYPKRDTNSSWHGTHVNGIIAAQANNGMGITGVAPNAKLLPARVIGKCGGYSSDVAAAIRWSVGETIPGVPQNIHKAQVINLSLGSAEPAACGKTMQAAIQAAKAAGAVVVIAAGNENSDAANFTPGNCPGGFTVAATTRAGSRASYSNVGAVVDVAAPGGVTVFKSADGILSTLNRGLNQPGADDYRFYQGTSMAAPQITGLAALIFSAKNDLAPLAVEQLISSTSRDFPVDCEGCGAGIADAAKAVAVITGASAAVKTADLSVELLGRNGRYQKLDEQKGGIYYRALIKNLGANTADNLVLTSVFPEQVAFISANPMSGNCDSDGLRCELGSLAVNEQVYVDFAFEVTADLAKTKFNFSGSVTGSVKDPVTANNTRLKPFGGALYPLLLLGLLLLSARRFKL